MATALLLPFSRIVQISSPKILLCAASFRASFTEALAPGFGPSTAPSGCTSPASGTAGGRALLWKPATVLYWHRKGEEAKLPSGLFWRWKSRKRGPGRPRISAEVRKLIVEMAEMNVGWGALRIHGELLKLGIEISEITVSRYMPKRPPPAGSRQRWAHLGLEKDAPEERPTEPREMGEVVTIPRVGELHHRYSRTFRIAA